MSSGFFGGVGIGPQAIGRSGAPSAPIAGMTLWLKADAITGLSDGDAVATWTDSSGNNYSPAQATADLRPTYKTGIVNNKPVVRFAADYLTLNDSKTTMKFLHAAKSSVFVVASVGASANPDTFYAILGNNRSSASFVGRSIYWDDRSAFSRNNGLSHLVGNGTVDAPTISAYANDLVSPQTWTIIAFRSDVAAAAADRLFRNINGGATVAPNLESQAASTANATDNLQFGSFGNGSGALVGDIAEIIIYADLLSDADRQHNERYLAAKYGITLAS